MANCLNVAQFFLKKCHDQSTSISNLKLQKLVYYAQGLHLAGAGERIFTDKILAWEHGPVVRSIYSEYSSYGRHNIPAPAEFDAASFFTSDEIITLNCVFDAHGKSAAWPLREQTHKEKPWLNHISSNGNVDFQEITTAEIKEFFKMKISDYSEYFCEYAKAAQDIKDKKGWVAIPETVSSADDFINWIRS